MAETIPFIASLQSIVGSKNVITDADSLAPYLTDWRGHYTGRAQALVRPETTDQVSTILSMANDLGVPVVPQGGNTGLCGGATPDDSGLAIILSMSRMNKIRKLDVMSRTITVDSGCILENIQQAADKEDLLFPLNFGSRGTCQIGGNLSTNAGGLNVVKYGNARALCLGLEVVLPDGKVVDMLSSLKKDNTGYDLRDLFIGAEGTLGVITGAVLQLFPKPKAATTAFVGVRDIDAAIELLNNCQSASGGNVIAFELMPKSIIDNVMTHYPDVVAPLETIPRFSALIEIASTADTDAQPLDDGAMPLDRIMEGILEQAFENGLISDATIASNGNQRNAIWAIRELTPESEIKAGPAYKSDISLPLEYMSVFYERAAKEAESIVPGVRIFGFGHLGDGNLHYNLAIPEGGHDDFTSAYPEFDAMLLKLLQEYGGSISAEHGIGQKKRDMLPNIKDPAALNMMQVIKTAVDPKGIMNPEKVIRITGRRP